MSFLVALDGLEDDRLVLRRGFPATREYARHTSRNAVLRHRFVQSRCGSKDIRMAAHLYLWNGLVIKFMTNHCNTMLTSHVVSLDVFWEAESGRTTWTLPFLGLWVLNWFNLLFNGGIFPSGSAG